MSAARRNENAQREAALRAGLLPQAPEPTWPMRRHRLGRHADQRRAHVHGGLERDQGRALGARLADGFQSNWPSGCGTSPITASSTAARAPPASATSAVRRSAPRSRTRTPTARVCVSLQGDGDFLMGPGGDVDRGAPPDSALDDHPQQSRLVPRNDVGPDPGRRGATAIRNAGRIGTEIIDPNINYAKWRGASACTPNRRSPIRPISARLWRAR